MSFSVLINNGMKLKEGTTLYRLCTVCVSSALSLKKLDGLSLSGAMSVNIILMGVAPGSPV